jgi:hypothetical protein
LLWFSSDEYLESNVKLVGCSVRFFIFIIRYWPKQIMFMLITLIIGNFLIIIIPSSVFIPISLQTALLALLIQFNEISLYVGIHGKTIGSHMKRTNKDFSKSDGKLLIFFVGKVNYNYQFVLYLFFSHLVFYQSCVLEVHPPL